MLRVCPSVCLPVPRTELKKVLFQAVCYRTLIGYPNYSQVLSVSQPRELMGKPMSLGL